MIVSCCVWFWVVAHLVHADRFVERACGYSSSSFVHVPPIRVALIVMVNT
jgi:hypothetical protein